MRIVMICVLVLLLTGTVQGTTTGEVYPTLGETVSEGDWSDNTWVTPTNIYADDAATANVVHVQFDSPDQTYVLKATGFDFSSIPEGAIIDGVICRVNTWYRSGQGAGSMDLMQLLYTDKVRVGTNQCATPVALTTNDATVISKGSSSDEWGNSLTAAWVKNSSFGVGLGIAATAKDADVDIDYVTLEIYYTVPAGSQETVYPNNTGEAQADLFQHEVGCNNGEHYNCVGNEYDASHVYDSIYVVDSHGAEAFDWVLTKSWASIDSIELTTRLYTNDAMEQALALDIVYWFYDGDTWVKKVLRECNVPVTWTEYSVVSDTNLYGAAWTQAMIESDGVNYEFGFVIGVDNTKFKFVSMLTMTVYGTEAAAGGNPRLHRKKRMGGIDDEENTHLARFACLNRVW